MPELPEVETTRRGIAAHIVGVTITRVNVRQRQLRWAVPVQLSTRVTGQRIAAVGRRGKYILVQIGAGHMLIHLGMSGSLRIVDTGASPRVHDHIEWELSSGKCLRFHDPRRFGSVLWLDAAPHQHPLLRALGPEPLDSDFDGDYLFDRSRKRKINVKAFIMNAQVVVGVGNIYACESLFTAGISPRRAAGRVSRERYQRLARSIQETLGQAIEAGGTTLRDFVNSDGEPGYFARNLQVYGREGAPCGRCSANIRRIVSGQRSTFYCPRCQR